MKYGMRYDDNPKYVLEVSVDKKDDAAFSEEEMAAFVPVMVQWVEQFAQKTNENQQES